MSSDRWYEKHKFNDALIHPLSYSYGYFKHQISRVNDLSRRATFYIFVANYIHDPSWTSTVATKVVVYCEQNLKQLLLNSYKHFITK